MPNIATALKAEISRLARKELRAETDPLKKSLSRYRQEIAGLKRQVEQLERQQKKLLRTRAAPSAPPKDDADPKHRFSAKGFASSRQRLGLSAADFGRLIGVSTLSIYKWEGGQQRPRARYLPAIAAVRKLGKREALAQLERLAG